VVHSFGREDQLDRDALQRMAVSINRYLGIDTELRRGWGGASSDAESGGGGRSRPVRPGAGGCWTGSGGSSDRQDHHQAAQGRRLDPSAERVLFMLVANRALAPTDHKSKLASLTWLAKTCTCPGSGISVTMPNVCYRAMDFLLEIEDELAEQVYWAVADLLDLEVDLLLFDTTSTYWETDRADPAPGEGEGPDRRSAPAQPDGDDEEARTSGFRTYGKSKDHRPDLPQVVVGMAVTRTGIPIRVWSWPGDTGDSPLIRQVKTDSEGVEARPGGVGRRPRVHLRENRRYLQRGGGHYIMGEKLRHGSKDAQAGAETAGPLQDGRRQPAGQGGRARRRHDARPVHRVPQPRRSPTRRAHPGPDRRTARASHRRLRPALGRAQACRARRSA
jgi:hypothetical protein